MRNLLQRIFSLFIFLIILSICLPRQICAAEQKENLKLYAKAAVLMDADSGRVLYGKNP